MDPLIATALDTASARGAEYADIRLVSNREQRIVMRNGVVETMTADESVGLGIRAVFRGAWGFASTRELTGEAADQAAAQAVQIARASASQNGTGMTAAQLLGSPVSSRGSYVTPISVDPFAAPLEDKLALLLEADREMASVPQVTARMANVVFIREERSFANTEGALVTQTIYEAGGGVQATAVGNGETQRRSYPQSHGRQQGCAGWEYVVAMDLPGNARRTAEAAAELLTAEPCPSNIHTDLIIDGSQLALQIHESCGHAVELDRALGDEAAFAGTSFLTPDLLNDFRYGSEQVSITADSATATGLGTFGWDDEGLPAQATDIIRNGQFVGYLMSREAATRLGMPSNGCMRASSWNRIPLIRMTNVSLAPGEWTLEDLIADTDDGIYLETNRSWSIDDRRYNFQFGAEVGREIKNGKLGRLLRNCTYTGITPEFWRSCDAVCGPEQWQLWGTPRCGKGQPGQIAHTSHGASPSRFRNVRVGVMR
jgi:TldD protein